MKFLLCKSVKFFKKNILSLYYHYVTLRKLNCLNILMVTAVIPIMLTEVKLTQVKQSAVVWYWKYFHHQIDQRKTFITDINERRYLKCRVL